MLERLDLINSVLLQSVIIGRVVRFFPLTASLPNAIPTTRPLCCLPLCVFLPRAQQCVCQNALALAYTHNCIRCQWTVRKRKQADVLAKQRLREQQSNAIIIYVPDCTFQKFCCPTSKFMRKTSRPKSGIMFSLIYKLLRARSRRRILIPRSPNSANQNKAHSARTYAQCQCFAQRVSASVHCYLRWVVWCSAADGRPTSWSRRARAQMEESD
jgi:hypothetical protein